MSTSTRTGHGPLPLWRDERVLKWVAQVVSAIAIIVLLGFAISNVLEAARLRGLDLGFGFLDDTAGFALSESVIAYEPAMSFGRAFIVGLLNTLKVSLIGMVLATTLGLFAALARLSSNWLVSKIASVYIETIRNVPLLVQLFFWYFAVFQQLPGVRNAIVLPGPAYLSQRGLYIPWPAPSETASIWLATLLVAAVGAVLAYRALLSRQIRTGRSLHPGLVGIVILVAPTALAWMLLEPAPFGLSAPELQRFNFTGGLALTTEFAALMTGLVIYTGSFIAEVIRAGILAVPRGQVEAARAVGLTQAQVLRLVVLPQALRVIIPPLISQYLNLTKNTSLAIAIGYPDLFFVGRTIINQAGRAVQVFLLVMAVYLTISLLTSLVMNLYNRRVALVER
jgi:general L-amino acid transport system permease protein